MIVRWHQGKHDRFKAAFSQLLLTLKLGHIQFFNMSYPQVANEFLVYLPEYSSHFSLAARKATEKGHVSF